MTSVFKLLEKDELTLYSDDIELVFIELPNFNKTLEECESLQDQWLYFIKHARQMESIPDFKGASLKEAFEIANRAGLSAEELELQEKREEFLHIQKGSITKAKRLGREEGFDQGLKAGHAQGLEQGLERGRHAERVKIAENLLAVMQDIEIVKLTGLTESEVADLRSVLDAYK